MTPAVALIAALYVGAGIMLNGLCLVLLVRELVLQVREDLARWRRRRGRLA